MQINKIQKNSNNTAFKQRFVIDAGDMLKGAINRELLQTALIYVDSQNHFPQTDIFANKILMTTDDDTTNFFKEYFKDSPKDVFAKYIKGAVEFGQDKILQLKKSILDLNLNYKIKLNDGKATTDNYNALRDYFSISGVENTLGFSDKLNEVLIAVKDSNEYSNKVKILEHLDISVREYNQRSKQLIQKYLDTAKLFTSQDTVNLKKHIRKILELPETT